MSRSCAFGLSQSTGRVQGKDAPKRQDDGQDIGGNLLSVTLAISEGCGDVGLKSSVSEKMISSIQFKVIGFPAQLLSSRGLLKCSCSILRLECAAL